MSNITNTSPIVTEDKLKDFYEDIKPYLGCPAYVTQEGDADYYSTDEKVIGRWTDGKPLYQKVYSGTTASSGVTSFSIANLSIDKVTDVSGYIEYATNNFLFLSTFTNANDKGIGYASRINAFIDTSYTSKPYVMVLQYTKTTDSASTTIEQKPTHYSTDEQVVGTWIDNKPIYQKTFTGTTSATTNSDSIAGTIANFDTLVNSNGTLFLSGAWGVNQHSLPYDNVAEYYVDDSNQVIIHKQNEIANSKQYMVTLQYTKTTD